ncbi:hypothetical protein CRG98_005507, partial [Punica granatum]
MTEINKADASHQLRLIVPDPDLPGEKLRESRRVASLDIFRGLTVALMILVDDAGGERPMIGHAPWNGCNLADFVMPFFLFIVGMAIPLAFKRIPDKPRAIWKRIALAYLVVALIEILTKDGQARDVSRNWFSVFKMYWCHWMFAACVIIVYSAVLYGSYVPDWEFAVTDTESVNYGKIYKDCTLNSPYEGPFRDDAPKWCFAPFEPEGILSSISAILSTIIGLHSGHVLVHFK